MLNASDFIHPEDEAALRELESIPALSGIVKKVMEFGYENIRYGVNMASSIRLSPTQLPHIYNRLPPICEQLGIAQPEFYLEMNPIPNAYTSGETRVFICVTSGLVEMMDEEELDAVIAHECGHILCHHVMYSMVAQYALSGIDSLGLLGSLAKPAIYSLLYWNRKSELSADRCAAVVTSPDVVARVMARLSGGPKSITEDINMKEWASQADVYDSFANENLWNKAQQASVLMDMSHPYSAIRVREILKWAQSYEYQHLVQMLRLGRSNLKCPGCHSSVLPEWEYCMFCGKKLRNEGNGDPSEGTTIR